MYLAVEFQGGIENAWSNVAVGSGSRSWSLPPSPPTGPRGASGAGGFDEVEAVGRRVRRDR
jgi:hypothetical protein